MVNQIRPLARLFRAMADLIDRDHTSRTRYEAIAKAAGVVAARATTEELVAGAAVAGRWRGPAGRGLRLPRRPATPGDYGCPRPSHAAVGAGAGWRPASATPFSTRWAWDGRPGRLDGTAGFTTELRRAAPGSTSAARSSPWGAGPGRYGQAVGAGV